jgi:murein DD-endopeptidase MepM/ murein hydrolase activator NlpD
MRPRARVFTDHSKLLISAAAAVLLSACSSDMERFADNPSQGNDSIYTASVPRTVQNGTTASDTAVSGRPLASAPMKSSGNRYASNAYNYQQARSQKPVYRQPEYDQQPQEVETQQSSATVTVEPGMTLYSIARANNVSVGELAYANRISAPYSLQLGQTLRIPGGQTTAARQPTAEPAYAKPPKRITTGGLHTVRAGETLYSLGRTYGVHPYRIADLNHLPHSVSLSIGQSIRIPNSGTARMAAHRPKSLERIPANEPSYDESAEGGDTQEASPGQEIVQSDIPQPGWREPEQQADRMMPPSQPGNGIEGLAFRWPVKGRVISEYGTKPNGLRNEGINISVPEGTGIRAAEGGIVAYAGNELKGYGNLVLIRHEGGWVTAYAHNRELFVKRGDTVRRGDVIAKAGQTGSVTSPQLHFEVRKGATAVDPMRFLNSATAWN